jgi:hypothetical protein
MFFSVNSAIWVHSLPENRLLRELQKAGHEISYVTCAKAFRDHCTSMSAFGYESSVSDDVKSETCRICIGNAKMLAEANQAYHLTLASYINDEDEKEIDDFVADFTIENYLTKRWNGIDVGKIASYEIFLKYKKLSVTLSDDQWAFYLIYLKNTLRSGLAFSRIFEQTKPEIVFCYSPQYAVNGIAAEIAIQRGATVYFIEGSSNNAERYEALRIWDWGRNGLVNPGLMHWDEAKLRVTAEDSSRINGHFKELFAAKSFAVYSSAVQDHFSTRQHFGVPDGAKLLLLTLSSFDEAFAAVAINKFPVTKLKSHVFENQFEWVQKTLAYVKGRADLFLIVRVHPRDFSNKREEVQSEQARLWDEILRTYQKNVAVNWPQDNISLYNMLQDVDALLTGWSATGVEALAFGIPVVTYDKALPSYPSEIHLTGDSEVTYYSNIEIAVTRGRRIDHAIAAYQWLAVSFSMGTLRIDQKSWVERIVAFLKRSLPLSTETNAKLDRGLLRYQLRRGLPIRSEAAALRQLVDNKASDLIEIAVSRRSRRKPERVAQDIRDCIQHTLSSKKEN